MDPQLGKFLVDSRLVPAGARMDCTPLPGGVSCDVWRIETNGHTICVKRPLPRLRVVAPWDAPVSRSAAERDWLEFAQRTAPGSAPKPLAYDPIGGFLALSYLDPQTHPVWKAELLAGRIDLAFAADVARLLAKYHAASAGDGALAARFDTGAAFFALRIDAYILESARRNPDVSEQLNRLASKTFSARIALVHGDVSPKNILVGPDGPVFLDAETAWFGDPAFDVAFCLNHLLLKCLARPRSARDYLSCFSAFRAAYLAGAKWERAAILERRAAHLLPALLLARVDGKSPVEYLKENDRNFVRSLACEILARPAHNLAALAVRWETGLTHA